MGIDNYMRQGADGKINMLLDSLPAIGFIDAIKTKNICKAQILTRKARMGLEPGSPDVKITSASGETFFISRRELANNFVLSDDSRIKISFLNSGKDYIVYNVCNEPYKVLKLPDNCFGTFQGKRVKPGSYMVCKAGEDGSIDMGSAAIMSPKMFKKMFKIPIQQVIKRHMGSGGKNFTLFQNRDKIHSNRPITIHTNSNIPQTAGGRAPVNQPVRTKGIPINTAELGMNPANINIPTTAEKLKQKFKDAQHVDGEAAAPVREENNTVKNNHYRFKVINKVVDMNGNHVGFTVEDLKTNEKKQITIQQLTELCRRKLVENVMLVTRHESGRMHLQGNGIVLNNLPQVIM